MKNHLFEKLTSLIAAAGMFISLTVPAFAQAPQNDSVTISSAEEFIDFAKSCSLDKWSHGKTVTLTADISLLGVEFTPVPIFGGTFDGGGHTISGLRIDETGSHQGLFRYLEKSAVVRELNVVGLIAPSGSRSEVGGIVGENAGTIRNCTFRGTVLGESAVGGIAGANSETGRIIECNVSGTVIGKSAAGGIAGRSEGALLKCTNSAGINLTSPDNSENTVEFDPESYIDTNSGEAPDILNSYTDSGGIVGYTSGIVQSCGNTGDVGYPHVGYNIGGIAGRQSGYMAGCTNSGTINGRKDVGGIVGQAEPYLSLDPGREILEELRTELHTLNDLIDKALNDVQGTGDDVSERLTAMKKYTDAAEDSCKEMLDEVTGFVDENVDIVNTMVADITNALDKIAPAMDELASAGESISEMSDDLGKAFEALKDVVNIGDAAMRDIRTALDDLKSASDSLSDAARYFKSAVEAMTDGVVSDDKKQQSSAAEEINSAAGSLSGALAEVAEASDDLDRALANAGLTDGMTYVSRESGSGNEEGAPETPVTPDVDETPQTPDEPDPDNTGETTEETTDPDDPDKPNIPNLPIDPGDFDGSEIAEILETLENNWNKAKGPLKNCSEAMLRAADSLSGAFSQLQGAAEKLDGVSDGLNEALDSLENAADAASSIGKTLQRSFTEIGDAVRVLTEDGPESFRRLGDDFRSAGNRLHGSVTAMTDDMEALNRQFNANSGVVADDLRAINDQLEVISDMVIDAVSELLDTASAPTVGDSILDTSDEDIAATRQGKVTDCVNNGTVSGDHNIGGIVGAMAIEFDLDPESDLAENVRFGATYETKAVLQNSRNYGSISAKKDCAGGAAGRMDLGTVISCANYGEISSSGGSYVGGIAGYSDAVVRNCYAKSVLSGGSYIGGITGRANDLRDNFAIVTVKECGEYVGAVAGSISEDGIPKGNRFVDTGTAGVDGISYAGCAEPIEFSELEKLDGVPKEFTEFGITLMADGKIVGKIPFKYGSDLSKIELPEVPVLEGSFGRWDEFDKSGVMSDITLEAVYAPWITIIASTETQDKLALALAEGRFTDEAVLHAEDGTAEPPAEAARVLNISITGADTETSAVPIRLLNTGGKNAVVRRLDNGVWTRVDSAVSGKYLLLEMSGMSGTFCIQPQETDILPILLIVGAAVILMIVIAVFAAVRKKKRGKLGTENK
ncbi:MAG: apolipoprotein A1/A4/E family protein [Ruminococcaceae bacterium]|nr:apolipoprotein A1/A4/E family protein [Oscillospiraceae bacterium]